jgi:hypothetical protein
MSTTVNYTFAGLPFTAIRDAINIVAITAIMTLERNKKTAIDSS